MSDQPAVLIAGGAGFIGAQTSKALAASGFLPVTVDSLTTGFAPAVRWGPLHQGDIRNAAMVSGLINQYRPVGAIHFAAYSLVGESTRDPAKYYDNNVSAGISFTRTLIDGGVTALVFSSTAAVYGVPQSPLIREDHPTQPINPYGASKLAFEGVLHWMGQAHGLRSTVLRYFNAAGADLDGEVGESHAPETHLIPLLCQAALGNGPPLTLYGTDHPTPDGTPIRDYVHVSDLAEAHVLALQRLIAGGDSVTMNVGIGEGFSVKAVVSAAEAVLGKPVPHQLGPARPGDPPALVADCSRIKTVLGWRPRYSDLPTMLGSAYAWQASRPY